jgi:histidinol-phosphate aminotransferase
MRGKEKMTKQNQPRGMKKLYALGTKRAIDLSLSENPLGCSPLVAEKLKSNNFAFNDYPVPNGVRLKKALVEKLGCQKENLFVCNGSESIINAIPKILAKPSDEAIVPALSFPMFALCSELAGLTVKLAPMDEQLEIDLAEISKLVNQKTKLIFLCNPNNPTGSIIPKKELVDFIEKIPQSILIVVDEANIEFGGESAIELAISKPNVMVLRTFSKGFGLASLRIGFAVGNQNLITKLEEETPVFPISGLSEELTISALQDNSFITKTKAFIDEQRNLIQKELESLEFTVFPSQANNLFVKLSESLSTDVFERAMEKSDISLVSGSSFAGFDNRFFRVSPRLENVNQIFLKTVQKVVNKETL